MLQERKNDILICILNELERKSEGMDTCLLDLGCWAPDLSETTCDAWIRGLFKLTRKSCPVTNPRVNRAAAFLVPASVGSMRCALSGWRRAPKDYA